MSKQQKGSIFEREVSKQLSLWFTYGADPDLFWRSTSSGARATSRGDKSLSHDSGDIRAAKPAGLILLNRFFVECKFYFDLQLANFLVGKPSKLATFWRVARDQALCYGGKRLLLIARQNRMPTLMLMEPRSYTDFRLSLIPMHHFANADVVVCLFNDFTEHAKLDFLYRRNRLNPEEYV